MKEMGKETQQSFLLALAIVPLIIACVVMNEAISNGPLTSGSKK